MILVLLLSWCTYVAGAGNTTAVKKSTIDDYVIGKVLPVYKKAVEDYKGLIVDVHNDLGQGKKMFADLNSTRQDQYSKRLEKILENGQDICFITNSFKAKAAKYKEIAETNKLKLKRKSEKVRKRQEIIQRVEKKSKQLVKLAKKRERNIGEVLEEQKKRLRETKREEGASKCRKKRSIAKLACKMAEAVKARKAKMQKGLEKVKKVLKHKAKLMKKAEKRKNKQKKKLASAKEKTAKVQDEVRKARMDLKEMRVQRERALKLVEQLAKLENGLKNVHAGITTRLDVVKRGLPNIVNTMKEVNTLFMQFKPSKKGATIKTPDLSSLEKFADDAAEELSKKASGGS